MEIKGKAHCFFEQSGTFKNEFIKLGIRAEDYDIQDDFGETDHVMDLFTEIENAYRGGQSVFDSITCDDLIMAFFPCVYFCENNQLYFTGKHMNLSKLNVKQRADIIMERAWNRERFYCLALKLFVVCDIRGIRLIVENPFAMQHYLVENFPYKPVIFDMDRRKRGDYYKKPSQYWFINCAPTGLFTGQWNNNQKRIASQGPGKFSGLCSAERSMISPDYARNFICDFVLGKEQSETQMTIF